MGTFRVRFRVRWGDKSAELVGLVDTGATYAKIPRSVLEKLGVRPVDRRKFELGDGRVIERDVGFAIIEVEVDGKVKAGACTVSFGRDDEEPVLGATTLECLGVLVDPVRKKLVEAVLLEK